MQDEQILYNPSQIPAKTWWERKRWQFNTICIPFGVLIFFIGNTFADTHLFRYDPKLKLLFVASIIGYFIFGNLLYTLNYLLEKLFITYIRTIKIATYRIALFYTEIILTILLPVIFCFTIIIVANGK